MTVLLRPVQPSTAVLAAVCGNFVSDKDAALNKQLLVVFTDRIQLWQHSYEEEELQPVHAYSFPERIEAAVLVKHPDGAQYMHRADSILLFMGDQSCSLFELSPDAKTLLQLAYTRLDPVAGAQQSLHPERLQGICVSVQHAYQQRLGSVLLFAACLFQGTIHLVTVTPGLSPKLSAMAVVLPAAASPTTGAVFAAP